MEHLCLLLEAEMDLVKPKETETSDTFHDEICTEELETENLQPNNLAGIGITETTKGGKHSDEEQSIIEEVNQDESEVILSNQQDILEKRFFQFKTRTTKRTQNHVTLEDVNKSAFEYFEKKQAPYRPPTSAK
ncbi:hypothetical protein JTB14_032088 [Gonioctena quinquepunctata]|nr:hypothetical protein JTB14_032088 [Gonioctena quinquepunctata]